MLVWLSPFAPLAAQALPPPPEPAPPLLSESEEIRISLEAAPAHLRDDAGVYVLESSGYRLARASRNGFHCIIERIIATPSSRAASTRKAAKRYCPSWCSAPNFALAAQRGRQ